MNGPLHYSKHETNTQLVFYLKPSAINHWFMIEIINLIRASLQILTPYLTHLSYCGLIRGEGGYIKEWKNFLRINGIYLFISQRILKESWQGIMIVRGVRCCCCSLLFVVVVVTLACPPMISLNGWRYEIKTKKFFLDG